MGMMISHDMLLGRWRLSLELFGRVFMEDVGAEPGSVKNILFFFNMPSTYTSILKWSSSLYVFVLDGFLNEMLLRVKSACVRR